jgi:phasin family protein
MGDRTAEEANRAGQAAADAGKKMAQAGADVSEKVAQAGANLFQQNADTMQNAWHMGLEMATALMGRSTDQLDRTLGFSGREAEEAKERTSRNAEVILYSTTEASKVMSGISREYMEFTRQQMDKSLERMHHLQSCRTPQEFVAAQGDFLREMITGAFESSRRMAEMSLKIADDAAKGVQNLERHAA